MMKKSAKTSEQRSICEHTIQRMEDANVMFKGQIPTAGGVELVWLSAHEMPRYLEHRAEFAAEYYGVTLQQYREWLETDGTPRCRAMTKAGKPCKNPAGDCVRVGIHEWVAFDGEFCWRHAFDEWKP